MNRMTKQQRNAKRRQIYRIQRNKTLYAQAANHFPHGDALKRITEVNAMASEMTLGIGDKWRCPFPDEL